jgi:hypothetical protein
MRHVDFLLKYLISQRWDCINRALEIHKEVNGLTDEALKEFGVVTLTQRDSEGKTPIEKMAQNFYGQVLDFGINVFPVTISNPRDDAPVVDDKDPYLFLEELHTAVIQRMDMAFGLLNALRLRTATLGDRPTSDLISQFLGVKSETQLDQAALDELNKPKEKEPDVQPISSRPAQVFGPGPLSIFHDDKGSSSKGATSL